MDLIREFFQTLYNVRELIALVGFAGLIFIIFAETGLMLGFFLPGDSLLVTAGVFAADGLLDLQYLMPALTAAAVIGNSTGFVIGRKAGQALYNRPDSFLFRRKHLEYTHDFYQRHGGKTIILAQFMPIARTFAPVVGGAAGMPYRRFATFNLVGAILWINSMLLIGYLLVRLIPGLEKRIDVVIVAVVLISISPGIIAWLRARLKARRAC